MLIIVNVIISNPVPSDSEPILVYRQDIIPKDNWPICFPLPKQTMNNPVQAASHVSYHKVWHHAEPAVIGDWTELVSSAKIYKIILLLSRNLIILNIVCLEKCLFFFFW